MKKLFSFMLIFILLISAVGCKSSKTKSKTSSDGTTSGIIHATVTEDSPSTVSENSSVDSSLQSESSQNSESVITSSENSSSILSSVPAPVTPEPAYKAIVCRELKENEWNMVELVSNTTNTALTLNLPYDWEITDGKIFRSGKQIGEISTKAVGEGTQRYESFSVNQGTIVFRRSIEEFTNNGTTQYKRLFKLTKYGEEVGKDLFFISVDLTELDNLAATKIIGTFNYLGNDRKVPQIKNDSNKFLFLGNSFIGSSAVANFLSDMLYTDGSSYTVETKFGGTVVEFAQNTSLTEEIENGNFACIFLCGFYYNNSHTISVTEGFKIIKEACEKSDTALIAFPAHNEHNVEINSVLESYPDIYCLHWKNEINLFIESAVGTNTLTESDFCENDHYKHSKPLAGYVGAHMIYRTLFGKMPPKLSDTAPLAQFDIDVLLGDYPSTGVIPGKTAVNKYYVS